jgi:HK97 family phage portal protein
MRYDLRNHARGVEMAVFDFFRKKEERNLENPTAPVSATDFLQTMGWGDPVSSAGVTVTIDNALGVPAVWSAVNFLSGTLAGLPLHVYRKTRDGRARVDNGVAPILNQFANDGMSSFEWLKYTFEQVFTGGRAVTYIERSQNGTITNLWPLDPAKLRVERLGNGRKIYRYNLTQYEASEVIDIPFMLKSNGLDVRGPIMTNKDAIGMAIAASRYGAKAFQSGGIPPAVLQGPFQSAATAVRASDDVAKTMAKLGTQGRSVMALPMGHELKSIGFNPEQMQLLELQRFSIEQIARIYSLPPVFLQDLTHGTFSNTEQQDLHFVKHTIKRWIEQFEAELNLKLFGRGGNRYAEFNVDGLLRGDFKTRMEAHATSIQNGIRTPNEVRDIENLPPMPEGGSLMIQGATVPIGSQPAGTPDANSN